MSSSRPGPHSSAIGSVSIGLSQMFTVTAGSTNPAYLVLTALDRNEYTAGASGATGSLSGNGHTLGLSSLGGDGRGAGIVFTYQASTGGTTTAPTATSTN